jgi:hypothetical protein
LGAKRGRLNLPSIRFDAATTLDSAAILALVLGYQGRYEQAEEMCQQELNLCDMVQGKQYPATPDKTAD